VIRLVKRYPTCPGPGQSASPSPCPRLKMIVLSLWEACLGFSCREVPLCPLTSYTLLSLNTVYPESSSSAAAPQSDLLPAHTSTPSP
jgi:hypothetical protein